MEELVVLLIFGLIILFNFIIKKLAGKSYQNADKKDSYTSAGETSDYSPPQKDVREFLQEIKRRAEEARTGLPAKQSPAPVQMHAVPAESVKQQREKSRSQRTPPAQDHQKADRAPRPVAVKEQETRGRRKLRAGAPSPPLRKSARQKQPQPAGRLENLVGLNRRELRRAIVMSEVLGKPLGMRDL